MAQTTQPAPSPVTAPLPGPFQSLGNIIRSQDAPPPGQVTGRPLALPTTIPPNTIGSGR